MAASKPSYIPTKGELVEKARELVPTLKERATKAEKSCRLRRGRRKGGPRSRLLPLGVLYPDDYTIIEAWDTEGLRGTGSHDIEVKERFLPAYRVVGREEFMNFGSPGAKLHDHYVYHMRMAPLQRNWFAAPLVGPARGALVGA